MAPLDGQPALLLELIHGCSLEGLLIVGWRPQEDVAVGITYALATAMHHAHQHQQRDGAVVHRDLKPSNVLLDLGEGRITPKVTDVGIAKVLGGEGNRTIAGQFIGTPQYASPEHREDAANVDTAADMWAVGAILFELLTGASRVALPRPPREGSRHHPGLSAAWRDLVGALLADDPRLRPSAEVVMTRLAAGRSAPQVLTALASPDLIQAVGDMTRPTH